jgi:hypothetical protein
MDGWKGQDIATALAQLRTLGEFPGVFHAASTLQGLSLGALEARVHALARENALAPSIYEFKSGSANVFVYRRGDSFVYHAPNSSNDGQTEQILKFIRDVFRGIVPGGAPDTTQKSQAVVVSI